MLQLWIEQYRKFGTCVDNRGKCTKLQNPNKGRQKKTKTNYQNMTKFVSFCLTKKPKSPIVIQTGGVSNSGALRLAQLNSNIKLYSHYT